MPRRRILVIASIAAVPVLAVGWWLGSPLFLDTEVSEAFPITSPSPDDVIDTAPDAEESEAVIDPAEGAEADLTPAEEPETSQTGEPMALATGEFRDYDELHRGSGTATIYQLEDGTRLLRLEDFEVTNGPALRVILVPAANPEDPDDLSGYVDLGSLKGNIGDQNYEIPPEVNLADFGSVVIYCLPFNVIFSVASLG